MHKVDLIEDVITQQYIRIANLVEALDDAKAKDKPYIEKLLSATEKHTHELEEMILDTKNYEWIKVDWSTTTLDDETDSFRCGECNVTKPVAVAYTNGGYSCYRCKDCIGKEKTDG